MLKHSVAMLPSARRAYRLVTSRRQGPVYLCRGIYASVSLLFRRVFLFACLRLRSRVSACSGLSARGGSVRASAFSGGVRGCASARGFAGFCSGSPMGCHLRAAPRSEYSCHHHGDVTSTTTVEESRTPRGTLQLTMVMRTGAAPT